MPNEKPTPDMIDELADALSSGRIEWKASLPDGALIQRFIDSRTLAAASPPAPSGSLRAVAEEVLRLDAEATPRPWECWEEHTEVHAGVSVNEPSHIKSKLGGVAECDPDNLNDYEDDGSFDAEALAEANAALIAHYRASAPALAAEVIRLEAEVERLRTVVTEDDRAMRAARKRINEIDRDRSVSRTTAQAAGDALIWLNRVLAPKQEDSPDGR